MIQIIKTEKAKRLIIDNIRIVDECWEWIGTRYSGKWPYGRVNYEGAAFPAHRFSYAFFYGPIPEGKVVMHICDNPPCINPKHLKIGTQSENAKDAVAKGRMFTEGLRGEHNPSYKLTEDQVRSIKYMLTLDIPQKSIASHFNVSRQTITLIKQNKTWRHV